MKTQKRNIKHASFVFCSLEINTTWGGLNHITSKKTYSEIGNSTLRNSRKGDRKGKCLCSEEQKTKRESSPTSPLQLCTLTRLQLVFDTNSSYIITAFNETCSLWILWITAQEINQCICTSLIYAWTCLCLHHTNTLVQLSPMLSSKKTNNRSQRPDFLLTSSKKLEGKRQSTLATDETDSFLSSNGQSQNIRGSWSTKSHRKKAVHFKKTAAYLVHVESKENLGRGVIKGGK